MSLDLRDSIIATNFRFRARHVPDPNSVVPSIEHRLRRRQESPTGDWVARQVCKSQHPAEEAPHRHAWVLTGREAGG
jgi:hypothetical protein